MEYVIGAIGGLIFIGALWVLPIWLGIRAARKNNRSALWMWFGAHPLGAWIAFAVLHFLPPLKQCSQCGEKAKSHAKICPYCMSKFETEQTQQGVANDQK